MIEMIYKDKLEEPTILAKGRKEDYKYVVISRGLYPECYIQLPCKHKLVKRCEQHIDNVIQLHGKISYFGVNATGAIPYLDIGYRILGWSYSQLGDFVGYYKTCGYSPAVVMKEWTTKEIVGDVKKAISQMKGIQYE